MDDVPLRPLAMKFPEPGFVIDDEYRLLTAMAQGGMSRIYRGVALRSSEPLAVKILHPQLGAHLYTVTRFYREARVSAMLSHPNVVRIYGYGPTQAGHHAIAMELLGGESLGSAVRRLGCLPWQRATHIIIELCDALGHAHSRGIVHRDLKPENIQLTGDLGPSERVKLMDFGIAYVAFDRSFLGPAPGSTNVSGTPAYMSPEQIRGEPLDGRSDLYALGVLLYEMLTGQRPFQVKDPMALCRMHLHDKPPSLVGFKFRGQAPPPALKAVCRELMAKSRQSRLPSVGALLERMLGILPQAEWPTRFTKRLGQTSFRSETGMRRTVITDVPAEAGTRVLLLQIGLESDRAESNRATCWSQDVDRVLAEWRAGVEASGAVVQQPEPDALRLLYGVYRPLLAEGDLADAVRATLDLKGRLMAVRQATGEDIKFKAAVLFGEAESAEEHWMGEGLRPGHALCARALCGAAPEGLIAASREVVEVLGGLPASLVPLGPVSAGPGIGLPESFVLNLEPDRQTGS
jgi:serine/threonine-protein kinase